MNVIKGYITTVIGLFIIVTAFLDFYGIIDFGHDHKTMELFIAFIVGLVLFKVPSTQIESWLKDFINRKKDKI